MDISAKDETIFSFAGWLKDQGKSVNTIKTYTGVLTQFYGRPNPKGIKGSSFGGCSVLL